MITVYQDNGDIESAILELKAPLEKTNNKAVLNIIRFQLLDIQKNSGQTQAAIDNLRSIIRENLK